MTRVVKITNFNGVSLDTANIKLVEIEDTGSIVHSRILVLRNGVKYDVDGTSRAEFTPGQVMATFEVVGSSSGSYAAETNLQTIVGLEGYRGTLTGTVINNTGTVYTRTCSARCLQARPRPVTAGSGTPHTQNNRVQLFVDVIFDKLTEWA